MDNLNLPPAMHAVKQHRILYWFDPSGICFGPFSYTQITKATRHVGSMIEQHDWCIVDTLRRLIANTNVQAEARVAADLLNLAYAEYLMLYGQREGLGYDHCRRCAQVTPNDVNEGLYVCARCGVQR